MSYLQLRCFITPPGHPEGAPPELQQVAEFRNSHGWGPMIWEALCKRYFGGGGPLDWGRLSSNAPEFKLMSEPEQVAFLSTCDLALIKTKDVKKWAEALLAFSAEYHDPTRINHIPEVVRLALQALEERPGIVAFCLYQSVGDDLWRIYEPELEDHRDYDLTKDNDHFCIEWG